MQKLLQKTVQVFTKRTERKLNQLMEYERAKLSVLNVLPYKYVLNSHQLRKQVQNNEYSLRELRLIEFGLVYSNSERIFDILLSGK